MIFSGCSEDELAPITDQEVELDDFFNEDNGEDPLLNNVSHVTLQQENIDEINKILKEFFPEESEFLSKNTIGGIGGLPPIPRGGTVPFINYARVELTDWVKFGNKYVNGAKNYDIQLKTVNFHQPGYIYNAPSSINTGKYVLLPQKSIVKNDKLQVPGKPELKFSDLGLLVGLAKQSHISNQTRKEISTKMVQKWGTDGGLVKPSPVFRLTGVQKQEGDDALRRAQESIRRHNTVRFGQNNDVYRSNILGTSVLELGFDTRGSTLFSIDVNIPGAPARAVNINTQLDSRYVNYLESLENLARTQQSSTISGLLSAFAGSGVLSGLSNLDRRAGFAAAVIVLVERGYNGRNEYVNITRQYFNDVNDILSGNGLPTVPRPF